MGADSEATDKNNDQWQGRGKGSGQVSSRKGHGYKQNWKNCKKHGLGVKDQTDASKDTDSLNNSKSSCDDQKKSREFSYSQMIPEIDLGITEYISKEPKIKGILKQRYSDFIVHEIDQQGEIVKLTNVEALEENDTVNYSECEKDEIIPEDKWQELIRLLEKPKEKGNSSKEVKFEVTDLNKDSRRNMHTAIRKAFGRKLQSNTQDQDGRKFIVVKKWTGSDSRGNWTRGKDQEYLHFVVHKQDMDTSETVNQISFRLRFKPSNLNFAGTKDRRACTSQKMSLWHGEPKRFRNLRIRNVWIGNYEFKGHTIKLGQLKGNLFTIALRNISNADEDEIARNMTSLKENGFINYFGTQRFGTNRNAPTHAVGRALLQADWEKAVNLILHPREARGGTKKAIECWHREKDAKKALSLVEGSRSSVEASLLRGLADATKNDYLRALNQLPRNLRLLYLHAYQSFIWNRIVSRRMQQFGLKVLPGDLVLIDGSGSDSLTETDLPEETGELLEKDADKKSEPQRPEPSDQDHSADVRVISAGEAAEISIDKIVLPTPGFKIMLPENECRDWYTELLAEDGFTLETLRQKSKEYSVGGSYRNFVAKPSQLEWKVLRYKEPNSPLLRTDPEKLEGNPEPQDDPDGKFRALVVKFGLNSSTYATIALREIIDYVGADAHTNTQVITEEEPAKLEMDVDSAENEKTEESLGLVSTEQAVEGTEVGKEMGRNQAVIERQPKLGSSSVVSNDETVEGGKVDEEESGSQAVIKRETDGVAEVPSKKPKLESSSIVVNDQSAEGGKADKEISGNQVVRKRESDSVSETLLKKPKIERQEK